MNTRSCPLANNTITFHICYSRESEEKREKDNNNNNTQQLTSKSKPMKLERNQKKEKQCLNHEPFIRREPSLHTGKHSGSPYSNGRAE